MEEGAEVGRQGGGEGGWQDAVERRKEGLPVRRKRCGASADQEVSRTERGELRQELTARSTQRVVARAASKYRSGGGAELR